MSQGKGSPRGRGVIRIRNRLRGEAIGNMNSLAVGLF